MKTISKASRLLFICAAMLTTTQLLAKTDDGSEKTKSYTKSYSISASDNISINNQFGETRLEVWNNNEIKVDVQIKVKASTEAKAQRLLDDITIEDGKQGGGVYFKTKIEHDDDRGDKRGNTEMHIDYVVHLPASNPLNLDTRFGDTYMPDYSGPVDIENKFGSLTAGNLTNVKELAVEFGKGDVQSMHGGSLTVKYSTFTIGKLSGDIEARFEFCDGSKITLDNGIKSFNLYNNYSTVKINTSKDLSATFDIETHFGDFSNRSDFSIKEDDERNSDSRGPKFDYHYRGKSGSGNVMVKVRSNFGTTTLM